MNNRVINIDGVVNARDLGGLQTGNGSTTNGGRFFRAAALHDITKSGIEQVEELGVSNIIDLRSKAELAQHPNPFKDISGINYYSVPMLDHLHSNLASGSKEPLPKTLEQLYEHILTSHKKELAETFNILADSKGGTIFHCTVGKDRTGLTSMFLLNLAEVPEQAIVDDYSLSESFLKPYFKRMNENVSELAYISYPSAMEYTLKWLNDNYGGTEQYLNEINVSSKTKSAIKDKLVLSN